MGQPDVLPGGFWILSKGKRREDNYSVDIEDNYSGDIDDACRVTGARRSPC